MSAAEQRWLTMDEMCTTLRLSRESVRALIKSGFLVTIKGGKTNQTLRVLDPTPEHKDKLRLAHMLMTGHIPAIDNLHEKALFTRREVDQIVGWTTKAGNLYISRHGVPSIRIGHNKVLFTAQSIRQIIWKRSGRKNADGRSPIVLTELIEWFRQQADLALVPTDEQFKADDLIQKKLDFIVRMSQEDRRRSEEDFAYKAELAKRVVQILDSAEKGGRTELARP